MLPFMLPGQFADALRRNGPALARWPEPERRAALLLLRLSGRARGRLADALDFPGEGPEDAAALVRLRGQLRMRLATRLAGAQAAQERRLGWAALAACAVVGIAIGLGAAERADAADALGAWLTPDYWAAEQ